MQAAFIILNKTETFPSLSGYFMGFLIGCSMFHILPDEKNNLTFWKNKFL
jgi:hypothetical protein